MAMTNRDRVSKALELLREGLARYVEREIQSFYGPKAEAARLVGEDRYNAGKPLSQFDVAALLKVMWESWNDVFRKTLGFAERSLVSELRVWRNRWAHQETCSSDDADRALDSVERLLAALSAPQAEEVRWLKLELRRQVYDEQVRSEKRRLGVSLIESSATSSLKPWREVAVPHPDVTSGRYQQAESAADLRQVYLGKRSHEYRDPVEFFRRTYLTESLRQLLANAILRLTGQGGDPVVQLQTNFGGGKTHSMLALFHLASGRPPAELSGVERAVEEATRRLAGSEGLTGYAGLWPAQGGRDVRAPREGVSAHDARVPRALSVRRVVLVGNRLLPGNPLRKPDGTEVRTLWGELAWQLGGREAYERAAAIEYQIIRRPTATGSTTPQWLKTLSRYLRRITFSNEETTQRVRSTALMLERSRIIYFKSGELQVMPYIDGSPAGTSTTPTVLWDEENIFIGAKLSKCYDLLVDELSGPFDEPSVREAFHACIERDDAFIAEYFEEHFTLSDEELPFDQSDTTENEANEQTQGTELEPIAELEQEESNGEVEEVTKLRRRRHDRIFTVFRSYAEALGFEWNELHERFEHADGSVIYRSDSIFHWERFNSNGLMTLRYWVTPDTLDNLSFDCPVEIWQALNDYPDSTSIIAHWSDEVFELTGRILLNMVREQKLTLYPTNHRVVFDHAF